MLADELPLRSTIRTISLPALSIQQPWAWLIAEGHKDIENRSWPTKFRGTFLIHAGQKVDKYADEYGFISGLISPNSLPHTIQTGGIVGIAVITDCVQAHESKWFSGKYGFVISKARPLPFMARKGQLGFFNVDYPESWL